MKDTALYVILVALMPFMLLAQTENWVYRYDDGSGANAVIYGADDNIYAVGSHSLGTAIVISLTTAGDTNWIYQNNDLSGANAVVYGADNNIYAAGYTRGTNRDIDFAVFSLTTAGDTNWVYRYDGDGYDDEANCLVYGADDNIYAAGYDSYCDLLVVSLTTAGDTNWIYRYNGPADYGDEAYSLVYGTDGNIYVAGGSYGSVLDFIVISLTTAGDTNWVYRYDGPGHFNDEANSIVYGADGNIYAGGYSYGSGTMHDCTVISLTPAGDTNWVCRHNGPYDGDDRALSVTYGADSNIYVAGCCQRINAEWDFMVISLTSAGDTNWVYWYDGPAGRMDVANAIVYGADDNIYAAGYSYGDGTDWDFMVISLTSAGDANWVYRYDGPGHFRDEANSLVYGANDNIYAGGYSWGMDGDADFIVISLPPDLGVEENTTAIIAEEVISTTIFSGPLRLPEGKNYRVFDITGRVVAPDKMRPGIYFIEIDEQITQKVVKIR